MELVIDNLTKTYANGTQALKGVSLTLGKGMFGLLGPNGAGKSTLMRTVATLQAPTSGSVRFNGIDALREPQALKAQLGYLPQDFGLYPRIDAYSLLGHFATLKGLTNAAERKAQVDYLLHKTNLYEHRKKFVGTYSGGMRQRFGIAQALLGSPKLIIVDEPTAGLDPVEATRFHNLLMEIAQDAVLILSTHIIDDVRKLCKEIAIIASGELVFQGHPESGRVALEGKIWRHTTTKEGWQALQAQLSAQPGVRVIATRLLGGELNIYVHADSAPEGFTSVPATLEEVYFYHVAGKTDIATL